ARRLAEVYPDARCALDHRSPWELLVATILSAQCTDKMVNEVTPALFEEFPDAAALAAAPPPRIEALIRRTGFFNQKARAIRACAREVTKRHGGRVPNDFDALVGLQGVGRKTASVVLGTAFGQPAVFVDTHVRRLSQRLALTASADPDRIEQDLKALLPPAEWTMFCHRLIYHGRITCTARAPACDVCPLAPLCPRIGVDSPPKR
ncbi:MAG: endonuclease III, partial [Candidatus Binatia bacterium]